MRPDSDAGFTLIEVLAALAIIAVALMAALRVTSQGISNVGELRSRLFASWVAENLLVEQRARGDWLSPGTYRGTARQGNTDFIWREEVTETSNPAFRRVNIFVFAVPQESYLLAQLTGFLARPPGIVP
ncbi:type II secretion system minor pseudopilin GspI [Nitrosospira sp. NpAV]|uniref:type II secretion system minor pseudopilin GspI n=1 Tax=Nitrosospira sp. NpAV TaxID=58133 RepID=UPI000A06FE54|nr:type II secretion system minor pseudopilin GspI [Nitrosospira sp. NpAV]